MEKFRDRKEAGEILAGYLKGYANQPQVIALALPRGGVPVAYEVANTLSIPLDLFIVRKLGVPGHEELAMGAIASGNTVFFNDSLIKQLQLQPSAIDAVLHSEQKELIRREQLYRGNRPFPKLLGKDVILIDDGIATGATMRAAVKALHKHKPDTLIIAVPVAAQETCRELAKIVDKLICPIQPKNFGAVGLWYDFFPQTSDSEVIELVEKANLGGKRLR